MAEGRAIRRTPRWNVLLAVAALAGCQFDGSGVGAGARDASSIDANPNAPDADPNAPDAVPVPDADPNAPDATPGTVVRINLAGPAHAGIDYPGTWADDSLGTICDGTIENHAGEDAHNTADDELFVYQMYGPNTVCTVGNNMLPSGTYTVRLYFGEVHRGDGCHGGLGNRIFDIVLEGVTVLQDFDMMTEGEGCLLSTTVSISHPVVKEFTGVSVTDGMLDISLPTTAINSMIAAVEVIQE